MTDPKVTWSRDGKKIKPSRYFKMTEYNGVYQLEVTETYPEDEGTYKITASNPQGEVSCRAALRLDSESCDRPNLRDLSRHKNISYDCLRHDHLIKRSSRFVGVAY